MRNILKISLFALTTIISSNTFAATGTGHAQAELTNPLTVANQQNVNFGTIAIDPAAGAQTVTMNSFNTVLCPATYVCSGIVSWGLILVTGAPSTGVDADITGSTATLSDGLGGVLVFDPLFSGTGGDTLTTGLSAGGTVSIGVIGTVDFTGSEVAGTYNTTNAGGTPYTVTVNY